MSLESTIADLVESNNALRNTFLAWKTEADTALAAALAAAPISHRYVFIDPVGGNDANAGTFEAPLLTLARAVKMTEDLAVVRIICFGDVVLNEVVETNSRQLTIAGAVKLGATYDLTTRQLTFLPEVAAGADGIRRTPSINFRSPCSLSLNRMDAILPVVAPEVVRTALFIVDYGGSVSFNSNTISCANAVSNVSLVSSGGGAYAKTDIGFNGVTIAANARGKIAKGVAANADPNSLWIYSSNLTAL